MNQSPNPLATAAASILANRKEEGAADRANASAEQRQLNAVILERFWRRYPDLGELLKNSGISVSTADTEATEDVACELVFTCPTFEPLSLPVTNYADDNRFAIGRYPMAADDLILRLGEHFAAYKANSLAAPAAPTQPVRSAGYYLGEGPAFPQPAGEEEGQPQGLTKREYLAGSLLQTIVAKSDGTVPYADMAREAVQLTQTLLDTLTE